MSTTIDATMHELVDRSEVSDLISRLGRALDDGNPAELRSLLAEDVTVRTPGGMAEGREAVVAQATRNHPPEQPIQHVITNVLVALDGDRAAARANLVVYFGPLSGPTPGAVPPAPPLEYTLGEVYHLDLVRQPDGWRFAEIQTTPLWRSGTPFPPRPAS
jgi:hypothetical protein